MSIKSKKTLVEVTIGLLLAIGYLIYALSSKGPSLTETSRWAIMMLATIGIGIPCIIVVEIAFNVGYAIRLAYQKQHEEKTKEVLKEEIEQEVSNAFKEDEMDKTIDYKVNMIAFGIVGIALIISLFLIAFNISFAICMNIVFAGCILATVTDSTMKIVFYEKGMK